ncbi:response regulator transcription factor [Aureisphaera galaxeae]|uniref:response regulator transcription factor n=1 Tax=Aureisphaera galaxeae TaxID=1538023 RepID=UPI002350C4D4|nr:response regulator transcription factor [Aureisphaera galaxeae]MDC8002451.1 response regulator transcription factor [Aureisphaera galaxeae]
MKKAIRIAIADDHTLVRSGITMILRSNSDFAVVQQSENGRELLEGLEQSHPDVVLLDLEMPVLSGSETLIEIRKLYPDVRVLILTMHNNDAFIVRMMELGANGYLIKNSDPDEVIRAIYKVVESEFYFSDTVSKAMLQGLSNPELKNKGTLTGHGLSEREVDVLKLICQEYTTTEIGEALFLSPKTIEGYRKVLMEKTEAKNMAGLVLFAVRHGIHIENS